MKIAENQSEIARLEDFKEIGEKAKEEINKHIDLNNKQKEDLEIKNKKIDELNLNISTLETLIKENGKNYEITRSSHEIKILDAICKLSPC